MQTLEISNWPTLYGAPSGTGTIRTEPDDFFVYENLSFEPSGAGEHVFLQIEKKGENTDYVAKQLAKFAEVRQRDIGYAGLKDRHAVTCQWFSVWLPGKAEPDWAGFESDSIKILQHIRHARKLKRGVLSGNRFKILVRNWQGEAEKTVQQLEAIKSKGLANYYGEQRFGYKGQNVVKALEMFQGKKVGREQRSLYLSAARSFLFNHILAKRIRDGLWDKVIAGDTYMFDLSHSSFKSEQPDAEIVRRFDAGDIHATGALWGKGECGVSLDAIALEQAVVAKHAELAQGLTDSGVDMDRRALRINVPDLQWRFNSTSALELEFSLPAGSYATALLREIIDFE